MKSRLVEKFICDLYENLVDYRYSKNKDVFARNEGIYFQVHVGSHCNGYEMDGNTHHPEWEGRAKLLFHVIMLSHHQVFVNLTEIESGPGFRAFGIPQDGWKNVSNHDSCWRDSFSSDLYETIYMVCDAAWANCPEEITKAKGSYDERVELEIKHGLLGAPFKFVRVDKQKDPEDDRRYLELITKVETVEKQITVGA